MLIIRFEGVVVKGWSVLSSQFSVLSSQFSALSSQLSALSSQLSALRKNIIYRCKNQAEATDFVDAINPFSMRPSSAARFRIGWLCSGVRYLRFSAIMSWVSISTKEPRAWLRRWWNSLREKRAWPSAILLGTETAALRNFNARETIGF